MALPAQHVSNSASWTSRDAAALAPVLKRLTDVVAVRGEGSWLIDADGARYLDLTAGIAVNTLGHCHPDVVAAVQRQASELMHVSSVARHPRVIELAERLRGTATFMDDPLTFFCNSGAEAVEGALKLARRVSGRPGVVAFRGAFHGRTLGATSVTTAKAYYRQGYEPLLPGVAIAPYGDLDGFESVLAHQIVPSAVGAVLVEPILGEGGYLLPPAGFLEGLRALCDRHGMLLVFDEVQCGAGRTGRFWAADTFGVAPDALLFAKGIGSGMPIGGIIARGDLMRRWPPAAHGSTFGGNPVSCAAALATIGVIERDGLLRRARVLGVRARDELAQWDARGVGLMIGVPLRDAARCAAVRARCAERGVLVLSCGTTDDVLRLMPPLTISDDEWSLGLNVLRDALSLDRE